MQNRLILEDKLDLTESELIELAAVSALPWSKGKELIQLPDDVRGLSFLDVGAGASDICATLLELGADAYAIDPRYRKKSEIIELMRMQIHSAPNLPLRIAINQTVKKFGASIKDAPERYKAASAAQIPFPDNTFDFVFSIDTVTAFFDRHREMFFQSIKECLRVTKPGGCLKFTPFQDSQPAWSAEVNALRLRNDAQVLEWLKSHTEVEALEISGTSVKHHHLLTFRKKAAGS